MIRSVPMLAALFLAGSFSATAALGADSDIAIKTFQFNGQFNTPLPGKGTTFSFTFSRAGTYTYFCDRHQSMRGEIRVK